MDAIGTLNFETVKNSWDEIRPNSSFLQGNLSQTQQRVSLLLNRVSSTNFDRNILGSLFVSGEPYRRECAVAKLVHDAVALV
jgi:hypothetical protein